MFYLELYIIKLIMIIKQQFSKRFIIYLYLDQVLILCF